MSFLRMVMIHPYRFVFPLLTQVSFFGTCAWGPGFPTLRKWAPQQTHPNPNDRFDKSHYQCAAFIGEAGGSGCFCDLATFATFFLKQNLENLLLMEEILHSLVDSLSHIQILGSECGLVLVCPWYSVNGLYITPI